MDEIQEDMLFDCNVGSNDKMSHPFLGDSESNEDFIGF